MSAHHRIVLSFIVLSYCLIAARMPKRRTKSQERCHYLEKKAKKAAKKEAEEAKKAEEEVKKERKLAQGRKRSKQHRDRKKLLMAEMAAAVAALKDSTSKAAELADNLSFQFSTTEKDRQKLLMPEMAAAVAALKDSTSKAAELADNLMQCELLEGMLPSEG